MPISPSEKPPPLPPQTPPRFRYRDQYGVIVMCADEAEQKRVYEDLHARGLKVKVVTV